MEPIQIEHVRDHSFKAKEKREGMKRRPPGCAECGRAQTHMSHHGHTQSVNYFLSKDIQVYRAMKLAWESRLLELLRRSGLERCERVVVEGVMTFPTSRIPDQGNHRFLVEKALGDALTQGGFLPDDTWDRYEFGNLEYRYHKGVSGTRLVLFPSMERPEVFVVPADTKGAPAPQPDALFSLT